MEIIRIKKKFSCKKYRIIIEKIIEKEIIK